MATATSMHTPALSHIHPMDSPQLSFLRSPTASTPRASYLHDGRSPYQRQLLSLSPISTFSGVLSPKSPRTRRLRSSVFGDIDRPATINKWIANSVNDAPKSWDPQRLAKSVRGLRHEDHDAPAVAEFIVANRLSGEVLSSLTEEDVEQLSLSSPCIESTRNMLTSFCQHFRENDVASPRTPSRMPRVHEIASWLSSSPSPLAVQPPQSSPIVEDDYVFDFSLEDSEPQPPYQSLFSIVSHFPSNTTSSISRSGTPTSHLSHSNQNLTSPSFASSSALQLNDRNHDRTKDHESDLSAAEFRDDTSSISLSTINLTLGDMDSEDNSTPTAMSPDIGSSLPSAYPSSVESLVDPVDSTLVVEGGPHIADGGGPELAPSLNEVQPSTGFIVEASRDETNLFGNPWAVEGAPLSSTNVPSAVILHMPAGLEEEVITALGELAADVEVFDDNPLDPDSDPPSLPPLESPIREHTVPSDEPAVGDQLQVDDSASLDGDDSSPSLDEKPTSLSVSGVVVVSVAEPMSEPMRMDLIIALGAEEDEEDEEDAGQAICPNSQSLARTEEFVAPSESEVLIASDGTIAETVLGASHQPIDVVRQPPFPTPAMTICTDLLPMPESLRDELLGVLSPSPDDAGICTDLTPLPEQLREELVELLSPLARVGDEGGTFATPSVTLLRQELNTEEVGGENVSTVLLEDHALPPSSPVLETVPVHSLQDPAAITPPDLPDTLAQVSEATDVAPDTLSESTPIVDQTTERERGDFGEESVIISASSIARNAPLVESKEVCSGHPGEGGVFAALGALTMPLVGGAATVFNQLLVELVSADDRIPNPADPFASPIPSSLLTLPLESLVRGIVAATRPSESSDSPILSNSMILDTNAGLSTNIATVLHEDQLVSISPDPGNQIEGWSPPYREPQPCPPLSAISSQPVTNVAPTAALVEPSQIPLPGSDLCDDDLRDSDILAPDGASDEAGGVPGPLDLDPLGIPLPDSDDDWDVDSCNSSSLVPEAAGLEKLAGTVDPAQIPLPGSDDEWDDDIGLLTLNEPERRAPSPDPRQLHHQSEVPFEEAPSPRAGVVRVPPEHASTRTDQPDKVETIVSLDIADHITLNILAIPEPEPAIDPPAESLPPSHDGVVSATTYIPLPTIIETPSFLDDPDISKFLLIEPHSFDLPIPSRNPRNSSAQGSGRLYHSPTQSLESELAKNPPPRHSVPTREMGVQTEPLDACSRCSCGGKVAGSDHVAPLSQASVQPTSSNYNSTTLHFSRSVSLPEHHQPIPSRVELADCPAASTFSLYQYAGSLLRLAQR
ncbi:hypothetical protein JAAARDRAFT_46708 [Jaapia argillacea MUCL 33604]|uniref:Uncharacterized protein n=1 Tax=Jaapia argillacea MUCL 33604 TaxID=933084 RepID=A0A067PWF3_9AGAM|nr:hypothetical protein JAAARDRAFT_46708 [Jaapia argillacea MUCL 33604]